jgi:type VI secretion system protein ImpF
MTSHEAVQFPESAASVFNFGVGDFSSSSLASTTDRHAVCESIKQSIEQQDSRLRSVVVILAGTARAANRLTFTIHASLRCTAFQESVFFDARFEPTVQRYTVAVASASRVAP